ncbi:hypothetical protein [Nocardioides donggukensis]|uniref:Tetratricopeptide repeat protein 38 n=1 Tax=Nocardioides donggukensis TaxID=2774019 RepID=A0A927K280_9ACTN|nr:hypothetical protein [Nocardioides donggukensis]MBD8868914.1 hypothetical protein [Nocardioides donggukensis]
MSGDPGGLSTSSEAADLWSRYLHLQLGRRSGAAQALREVHRADPGFAVGRAAAGLLVVLAGEDSFDAAAEVSAARSGLARHDWERSFVSAVGSTADAGLWRAAPQWLDHHRSFPADLIGFQVAAFVLLHSTRPEAPEQVAERIRVSLDAVGEHPLLLGMSGMLAQERGDLAGAHRLASRALELDPSGFDGGHPMTHVFLESGEHAAGLSWLEEWLPTADGRAPFSGHLAWHAALHELALGDPDAALARHRQCATWPGAGGLVDGASLLWRGQLWGHVPSGTAPWGVPWADTLAALAGGVPTTFLGVHALLALAAAGDVDGLRRMAVDSAGFTAPGAAELLPPLAEALAAFVSGDVGRAVDLLLAEEPRVARYGGSHVQRAVVEDTLIEALVRSGRVEEAATRLRLRLDRRPVAPPA